MKRERGLVKTENYHARTHIFTQTDTSVVVLSRQILCYFFPMFAYLHFLISNNDYTTWAYWEKKKERKQWNAQLKVKKQNKAKQESHNLGAFICFSKCKELSCRAWWVSLPTLCIPVILLLQSDDGGILMPFVLCLFHTEQELHCGGSCSQEPPALCSHQGAAHGGFPPHLGFHLLQPWQYVSP